jgi:hypothetical protein
MSGHQGFGRTTGQRRSTAPTSGGGAGGAQFESPTRLPRALRALAHEAVVTEDEPHPNGQAGANHAARYPASSSTAVPQACHSQQVLNGPERTTTDNHEAGSTCAVSHPRRCQQHPIRLWARGRFARGRDRYCRPVLTPNPVSSGQPRAVSGSRSWCRRCGWRARPPPPPTRDRFNRLQAGPGRRSSTHNGNR